MEILCIGNELLIGKVLNTNGQWLARYATKLGITVRQMTVVTDDVKEIARTLLDVLARKPNFVITTGGLGPTFDDKTLKGIAEALKRKLEINDEALRMIKERYYHYITERKIDRTKLTPSNIKMAKFPQGAEPLNNPVGTAPGMKIRVNETLLAALPGVPSEMESIFEESLAPLLKKESGEEAFFEKSIYLHGLMESALAPVIDQVMHDNKPVYIKSHPKGLGKGIEIHFSITSREEKEATEILKKAVTQLSKLAQLEGGQIEP